MTDPCLFKIADGTLMFSKDRIVDSTGVHFDMKKSWIVVTKTNENNETDVRLYSGKDMIFKPSTMFFPWTSIIMSSDADEESISILMKAVEGRPDDEEEKTSGLHIVK